MNQVVTSLGPGPQRGRLRGCLVRVLITCLVVVIVLSGWNHATRTRVSPAALATAGPGTERSRALVLWREAIAIVNEFLASPFNHSMPRGQFVLEPESMVFTTDAGRLSIEVWNSLAGDVAVLSGAVAQECSGGFRVGDRAGSDPHVDHSWFRNADGSFRDRARVAKTLLHETAHAVHRSGNFGFLTSFGNYVEIVCLWRAWGERSFELAPIGVDHEYWHWLVASPWRPEGTVRLSAERATEELDAHLIDPGKTCLHGAPEDESLPW